MKSKIWTSAITKSVQISDVSALITTLSILLECWYPGFRNPRAWPSHLAPDHEPIESVDEFESAGPESFTAITEEDFERLRQ